MAAPVLNIDGTVVMISDDEVEEQWGQNSVECSGKVNSEGVFRQRAGKIIQWVPRAVSSMLHKVQAWEVENQAVFRLGEQVEFVDRSGLVLRGTVCGEASGDGKVGRAQVVLDFWQSDQGEVLAGCESPHVSGGHGVQTVHQQFGQLAGVQSLPVKVGAPLRHWAEGRVKSGSVYPTSREAAGHGALGQGDDPVFDVRPSTSWGASASLERVEEELLDYDEEVEEHVASVPRDDSMETPRVVRKVVQGDHLGGHRRELVAGNLPRGDEGVLVSVGFGGGREGFGDTIQKVGKGICGVAKEQSKGSVDASIQVGLVSDNGSGKSEWQRFCGLAPGAVVQ
ncbi:hypothetical protein NDU88_003226 [Pleurodeles waltl]|uniref:Uncharacterized protein n=1 Tax=Pleurodeles waltl TaxID=8319 RepID=A0AAV7MQK9_PLEWA|nr:hypothetical protein NDU88_003226 [Pleurodeles waltl]